MKNFCLDLREYATKIKDYEKKKEMVSLTHEEKKRKYIISKRFVTYAKKDLVLTMAIKIS